MRLVGRMVVAAVAVLAGVTVHAAARGVSAGLPATVSPAPGVTTASPATQISFRGIAPDALGPVAIRGSASGPHSTRQLLHSDGRGVSLVPVAPFVQGETVTVTTGLAIPGARNGTYTFGIAVRGALPPVDPSGGAELRRELSATVGGGPRLAAAAPSYMSRPDLHPPLLDIVSARPGRAPGYLLASPLAGSNGTQIGPLIYDDSGQTVWFRPSTLPSGHLQRISWFGTDALAWFEGQRILGIGAYAGEFIVVDSSYQEIARIRAGNGYQLDIHDLVVTPWGTAFVVIYSPVTMDLTAAGGRPDAIVVEGVIQEVDLRTGAVLFEWHSLTDGHFPITDSLVDLTTPVVDYLHLNSIALDTDGNVLATGRHISAAFKVDRTTGEVIWRLGGRRSSFSFPDGDRGPQWPHDVRRRSDGTLSVFDNGVGTDPPLYSRGVAWTLDESAHTATRALELRHRPDLYSPIVGDVQELPNGGSLVSFGTAGTATEFDVSGTPVFESQFDDPNVYTYRTYRQSWHGRPAEPPALAVRRPDAAHATAAMSWNGATEVARWQLLAGPSADSLRVVGDVARSGFETTVAVSVAATDAVFVARALAPTGTVLGASGTVDPLLFDPLGGVTTDRPALSSWFSSHLDAVVRGTDGAVWHTSTDDAAPGATVATWSAWERLGGVTTSGPASASWSLGRLDVFVRGADNGLWHRWSDGGQWSGWESLGGILADGPAVVSWSAGRLDVFVVGADAALWHRWFDGGRWSGWESLGGALSGAPSAASWASGRLDVTAAGPAGEIVRRTFELGSGWSPWETLGGTTAFGTATAAPAPGDLRVVVTGTDGRIWQRRWINGAWDGWSPIGGRSSSGPAVAARGGGVDVLARATDGSVWRGVVP